MAWNQQKIQTEKENRKQLFFEKLNWFIYLDNHVMFKIMFCRCIAIQNQKDTISVNWRRNKKQAKYAQIIQYTFSKRWNKEQKNPESKTYLNCSRELRHWKEHLSHPSSAKKSIRQMPNVAKFPAHKTVLFWQYFRLWNSEFSALKIHN